MTTILTTTGISLSFYTRKQNNGQPPTKDQMRQCLRGDPHQASAEANSLLRMSQPGDALVFLHTQTPEAVTCAELLAEYFRSEGYHHVKLVPLHFVNDPKQVEAMGLRNLIDAEIKEVEQARKNKQDVVINATAGLKAQVVYSTMIGMIYQIPVKYLYEDYKTVITFNPIGIEWNTNLFLDHDDFFSWLDDQPRTSHQVDHFLENDPDQGQIKAFLAPPDKDNAVFLSDLGKVLFDKFCSDKTRADATAWPEPAEETVPMQKLAESIQERKHHPADGGLRVCLKIAALDCVRRIISDHYEPTKRSKIKDVTDNGRIEIIWKGPEKGERFIIFTTALGKLQTLKVAQKIKEILEID